MKKLINRPDDAVREELQGVAAAHAGRLRVNMDPAYIVRADAPIHGKVAIVSGGGSGHEPMHGGYVGMGMLDAACPGQVFTSPTPDQMLEATKAVDGGAGVLHIVKNYTGDVMNFEMAADLRRRRRHAGWKPSSSTTTSRCRTACTPPVAAAWGPRCWPRRSAERPPSRGGRSTRWPGCAAPSTRTARSMGVALTSCTVPMAGRPTFDLGDDEMEVGVGIHGEPGRERRPVTTAHDIVHTLATAVLEDLPFVRGDEVLAFVNGMGGTPLMELYVVYNELDKLLRDRGIGIRRNLVGSYMTALDMAGCSITLLRLDDELTALWDAPVATPGLRWDA